MATKRLPISIFVKELEAALYRDDGYIMGARGQNPKTGSLDLTITESSSSWLPNGYYYTQYNKGYSASQKAKALYWRENATRVWDCNGLAEGIYEIYTGININARARDNYESWCDPKSGDMSTIIKVPGIAVFKHSASAGAITHVGYLWKPVDAAKPNGDWYVIEAKGVLYGVVSSKLSKGGWNRWGKMTKYFDYETDSTEVIISGDIEKGDKGPEVLQIQKALLLAGEKLPRYGADGSFGSETVTAVKSFQRKNGLEMTGTINKETKELLLNTTPANIEKIIQIVGGDCYVRTEPSTEGEKLGVVKRKERYPYAGETSEDGWNKIVFKDKEGWVSGKYSSIIG